MEAIHERIQTDLHWFIWIAFAAALPIYHFLRQRDPLIRWHEHGNVETKPFSWQDVAVIVAFFLLLPQILKVLAEFLAQASEEPAKEFELSSTMLLTDALTKIALISFFIVWFMLRKVDLIEIFGLRRLSAQGVAIWGLVVGLLAIPLVMSVGLVATPFLEQFLGEIPPQRSVQAFVSNSDIIFRICMFIVVVFVSPVFEEIFYRGYLYGVAKRYSDRFFATFFSSMVFMLAHPGVITVLPIFTLAIFLVLAYELSGCLWVPIVIHMLFNLANVIGMLVAPMPS